MRQKRPGFGLVHQPQHIRHVGLAQRQNLLGAGDFRQRLFADHLDDHFADVDRPAERIGRKFETAQHQLFTRRHNPRQIGEGSFAGICQRDERRDVGVIAPRQPFAKRKLCLMGFQRVPRRIIENMNSFFSGHRCS